MDKTNDEDIGRDIYFTKYDKLIPVEALLGIDPVIDKVSGRNSGRSFRIALDTIRAASANPHTFIKIKDHPDGSDSYLDDFIHHILRKLNLLNLFETREIRRTYSKDTEYFIRYHPKTPEYHYI